MFDDSFFSKSFGRGFGPGFFGPGGFGFGPQRFFERGMIKYVILHLISEQPRHGYDVIQELEKQFHGMYSPSAGTVYPILQLLEDQDYITADQKEGKKVYSITKEGEKYLSEHKDDIEKIQKLRGHFHQHFSGEMHDIKDEVREIKQLVFASMRKGAFKDPETLKAVKAAVHEFKEKLEVILHEGSEK